jgi:hypothetical protein
MNFTKQEAAQADSLQREVIENAHREGRRKSDDAPKRSGRNGDGRALPIIFGIPTGRADYRWLVDNLLPEVGVALFAGQRGMLKTFGLLDLIASVISGGTFAGRQVRSTGGALYFAAEAPNQIPVRLRALEAAGKLNPLSFAWVESAPILLQQGALETLIATAESAKAQHADRGLPLRLIVIDAIGACAGWTDENNPTEALKVMGVLDALARHMQCLVIGADNFGKAPQSGVRGGSPKEDRSDTVLAFLGELEASGAVKGRRMAIRKLRDGPSGVEFPLSLRVVELSDGQASGVIEWKLQNAAASTPDKWPKRWRLFRVALSNALASHGETVRPHHDGPTVKAVRFETARREFAGTYTAKGETREKQAHAMREAFRRAVNGAREQSLIGVWEASDGVRWLWLPTDRTDRPAP